MFELAQRGYAAVDSIAYIAANTDLDPDVSKRLLSDNVEWLVEALQSLAERADTSSVDDLVRQLTVAVNSQTDWAVLVKKPAPPSLLSQILDLQATVGHLPTTKVPTREATEGAEVSDLISHRELDVHEADLRVYDAGGSGIISYSLPLVRTSQGGSSGDATVEDVYYAMAATWQFYRDVLGRDSIDGKGSPVSSVVHFQKGFSNVYWDGERLIVGDGDGVVFLNFSRHIDILAHELSHAITEDHGIQYKNQAGAISESFCDIMGILVKQWSLNQTVADSDWLLADGILLPSTSGHALRSLKMPGSAYDNETLGRDPQPSHMRDYVTTDNDNGGVHINGGILNRAFYLASDAVGGYAWETTGLVWYRTLNLDLISPTSSFAAFAGATIAIAKVDYVDRNEISSAVEKAWREVGIKPKITKKVQDFLADSTRSDATKVARVSGQEAGPDLSQALL
jgi:Zn-dependent metalloprotease